MSARCFLALAAIISGLVFIALVMGAGEAEASEAKRIGVVNTSRFPLNHDVEPGGSQIDENELVPIYKSCALKGDIVGTVSPMPGTPEGGGRYRIILDVCAMERFGYERSDIRETIEHEIAHTRGFSHHESIPRRNAAYYP